MIGSKEFSFAMYDFDQEESHVDFGPAQTQNMVFGTDEGIYYFPMLEDYFWSVLCQGVAFGTTQNPYLLDGGAYTVLDTGTSHLFLPASLFDIYL